MACIKSVISICINGCPETTGCPRSTMRRITLPDTRNPRSLCTRAVTAPVNDSLPPAGVVTVVTRTSSGCVRGSSCARVSQPASASISVINAAAIVVFISILDASLLLSWFHESLQMWCPSSWCPASSKGPEGGDRCSGRSFSRQCEIVSCHKQLPIGIQDVSKGNRARFISLLRAVPYALQSCDLNQDFVASQFRLGQLAERVLYILGGPQDGVPVSQDRLGVGARRVLHFGIDSSKVEEPPPQPGDRAGLKSFLTKQISWTNRFIPEKP